MGLFDFIKGKEEKGSSKNYLNLLKELGIDFDSYVHEDMEPVELTIDDEVEGIIKTSDFIDTSEGVLFNYVSLSDKKDGRKELTLNKLNSSEHDIKDMVNKFYSVLGEDYLFNGEFNSEDLDKIRNNQGQGLRRWDDESGYNILLGYDAKNESILIYIM